MANVFDVAAYILEKIGEPEISTMKLQKLVYYSQAWSLVWDERPIFPENIQAWANGPVVGELFCEHRGMFSINSKTFNSGNANALSGSECDTVDAVIDAYGHLSGMQLSELTHRERPWRKARVGLGDFETSNNVISTDEMQDYYAAVYREMQS